MASAHPNHIPLPMSPPTILRPALKHPGSASAANSRPASPLPAFKNLSTSPLVSPSTSTQPLPSMAPSASELLSPGIGASRALVGSPSAGGYTTKVSFDTFATPTDTDIVFSYTLQVKSEGYKKTRNTRVYLVASSPDESGKQALDWTISNLIEDGDELVIVRGFDSGDIQKDMHDQVREEARELLRTVLDKNTEFDGRRISVIIEFVAGKVTEIIDRMIALYRPDSMVVGTRGGRSLMQTWGAALGAPGMGSVSRYCVSHSPVPVIVVRPERKVKKTVEKRRADPKRRAQYEELTKTKSLSGIGL